MYYGLENNCFFANGTKYGCIYDLNSLKICKVGGELKDLVEKMAQMGCCDISDENSDGLQPLIKKNLVYVAPSPLKTEHLIPTIKIRFAWIEVTTACNLRCVHCYEDAGSMTKQVSISEFQNVVEQLKSIGVNSVCLIGGEPLLHPQIKELIKLAKKYVDKVEVFSNLVNADDNIIDLFKELNVSVATSLYSNDCKQHEQVTMVPGSFEQTKTAISNLIHEGIDCRICQIKMNGIKTTEKGNDNIFDVKESVVKMAGRAKKNLLNQELIRQKLITESRFKLPINKYLFYKNYIGHNCFSDRIYISADMEVYPCDMERRVSYGNIKEKGLKEIIDSCPVVSKNQIETCKHCEYRYQCFDCRCDSFTNDIYGKPWYCTYNPEEGVWADPDKFAEDLYNTLKRD